MIDMNTTDEPLPVHVAEAPADSKAVWRCVHDGTDLFAAFETTGQTESVYEIVDFDTQEEMDAAIDALGLTVDPDIYTRPDTNNQTPHRHAR